MSKGTVNKATIIGRLGKDPELKFTPSGIAVATFNIATTESYKDKEGKPVETTDWHRVVAWKKLAEICGQYLKKGSLVYIEGKIKTRSYDNKAGAKVYITEINADEMQMLGDSKHEQAGEQVSEQENTNTDDLPF